LEASPAENLGKITHSTRKKIKTASSSGSRAKEDRNWNIDATLENFTNVMLGISIYDEDEEDGTDTPSVSQP
jgi:hypothetical protein